MRVLQKIILSGAALALLPLSSLSVSAAGTQWDHNDSVMRYEEDGKKRRFVYDQPRQSLKGAGVKNGTVLFEGEEKKDGRLAGYAKLFRKGCDPIDYFVEGSLDKDKGEVLLQGQVPIYSGDGCKITGYSDSGSASSLRFTRLGGFDDGRYAGLREEKKREGYLPPVEFTQPSAEPPVENIEPLPPQRRESRPRERVEIDPDRRTFERYDRPFDERYEERERRPEYNYRERRAARDGRYDEEDAEFYGDDYDEYDEDDYEFYSEYDEYDEGPAYYPLRLRWRRY